MTKYSFELKKKIVSEYFSSGKGSEFLISKN